jgi:hypothetical protein
MLLPREGLKNEFFGFLGLGLMMNTLRILEMFFKEHRLTRKHAR